MAKSSSNPLQQTLKAISKIGLEKQIVDLDPDKIKDQRPHISTGSVILDRAIGGRLNQHGIVPCPGLPEGGVINLYGMESSGKSTLALSAAAAQNRKGKTVLYLDWENEVVPHYAQRLGVAISDPNLFMLAQPETLEQGMKMMYAAAHHGVSLIVIDSVGTAIPEEWVEEQALKEKGTMGRVGLVAAKWSRFLPQLKIKATQSGTVILGISQLRSNIQTMGMGPKYTIQGGKIWNFQSSVRIMLRKVQTLKERVEDPVTGKIVEEPVGIKVKATLDKCKISTSQGKSCEFQIRMGEGIDNIGSFIDLAASNGLVKKAGSWLTYMRPNGEEIRVQGAAKLRKKILEDDELREELENLVLKQMYASSEAVDAIVTAEEEEFEISDELDLNAIAG